jgi:hypothetical protein
VACFTWGAMISRSGLKTGGDTMWMVHVASSWRLRRDQAEDGRVDAIGCVGPYYPYFAVYFVLGPMGILVFCLLLRPMNRTLEGWSSLPLLQVSFTFLY